MTRKIRSSPFERPINDSADNVIRIRSRRARPVCIQESENFWRKVAREVKGERERSEEKAKFFATVKSEERATRHDPDIDDDDDDDDNGEIEERKGWRKRRFYRNVYRS
jgi:hypothetical protein